MDRAGQRNTGRPMISSFMSVMDAYARKGDTHNTEKMFLRLKEAGYLPRLHQFQTLVKAYVNAKAPLYGIKDRLKAENVVPSNGLSGQIELVNPFKTTSVSDLLDWFLKILSLSWGWWLWSWYWWYPMLFVSFKRWKTCLENQIRYMKYLCVLVLYRNNLPFLRVVSIPDFSWKMKAATTILDCEKI